LDQVPLVGPDIPAGRKLVEALDSKGLQIEIAAWWLDNGNWKLILATPRSREQGPLIVYSEIRDVIESSADLPHDLFDRIQLFSPGAVTASDDDEPVPLGRFVIGESVRRGYVEGAYFYRYQLKSFAKAS
jgi:hypothetical protein